MTTTTTTTHPAPVKKELVKNEFETGGMLADLRHDMEALWERPFQLLFEPFGRTFKQFGKTLTAWTPNLDVFEKEGELIVKLDVPGLNKEDFKVTIEEGDLVLRGERKTEKEVNEGNFYRAECNHGAFYRRLALPFEADPTLIVASYNNGVLEVKVPIPAATRPETHTIPVT